ncbi:MAG: DNA-binding LytR/AlgR family response regulator [Crocinitomix sp.]|jgi:DNA-binding LytR/AlgR family response regulator
MRIVILEDEFFVADHLREMVIDQNYDVVGLYHSGEDFLKETDWNFDIALVDIFLSEKLLGLDVAARLQEKKIPFIFLTANKDLAILKKAAFLSPKAYLSKPFNENDVIAALEIVSLDIPDKIEVRGSHGIEEINPKDIVFIKSDGAYIQIQTKKRQITQRKLLKEIEEILPINFVRTHRSYIVNKDYITQKKSTELYVDGHIIPISKSYKGF